jgi:hypothetical protein
VSEPTPAERLLIELGVSSPKEIDLEAIAWDAGAEVRYAPLDSCEARIIGFGNRAIITVEESSIPARKRFSVGHELGHWKFHRGRSFVCRKDDIGTRLARDANDPERIADAYSADLLMPAFLIRPLARKMGRFTFEAVDELRDQFQVSREAMTRRMIDIEPEPAVLIRHSSRKMIWFRRTRSVPDRWFPRNEIDAESGAMEVLYGAAQRSRRQIIGADAWFYERSGSEDLEVFEQSQKLSNGDVMTIVTFKSECMLREN